MVISHRQMEIERIQQHHDDDHRFIALSWNHIVYIFNLKLIEVSNFICNLLCVFPDSLILNLYFECLVKYKQPVQHVIVPSTPGRSHQHGKNWSLHSYNYISSGPSKLDITTTMQSNGHQHTSKIPLFTGDIAGLRAF